VKGKFFNNGTHSYQVLQCLVTGKEAVQANQFLIINEELSALVEPSRKGDTRVHFLY